MLTSLLMLSLRSKPPALFDRFTSFVLRIGALRRVGALSGECPLDLV